MREDDGLLALKSVMDKCSRRVELLPGNHLKHGLDGLGEADLEHLKHLLYCGYRQLKGLALYGSHAHHG